jgi:hypothetical protein
MDPVTMVVTALAAGAAAGLKDTVATAISDAYNGLKRLISDRYPGVSTSGVEKKPESEVQQSALAESLSDADAGNDSELQRAAQELLEAIEANDPGAAKAVGVDLSRIEAGIIEIRRIRASEGTTGVRARDTLRRPT